ncbi:MAG: hypothetical protein NUW13_12415 [candidate division KSB1 bacterium]|nr:hypothetical protein [candidate division KSB1 bacterium]
MAWPLNWSLRGMRTHLLFFPLWLGYCLAGDGLVVLCKGNSPLTRGRWAYGWLFLFSVVAWWLFELIDLRTQNWFYLGRERVSDVMYAILASLSFSTVMPAAFTSAEWVGCALPATKNAPAQSRIGKGVLVLSIAGGCLMLALLLAWPNYFFPLVWLSLFFYPGPAQRLVWPAIACRQRRGRKLAAGVGLVGRRDAVRLLLGDVELLLLPQVGLPGAVGWRQAPF